MIYFLIPLRSKAASVDWNHVTRQFNRTLESCYNQTKPEFKVFVACHEIPELNQSYDERVKFIQVSIPTPQNPKEMMHDKAYKLYTLTYHARKEMTKYDLTGGGVCYASRC